MQSLMDFLSRLMALWITLAIPFLLVLGSARLVMTPLFLQFEYTRPGFPDDFYGFTTEDRLLYGPLGVEYMLNGEPISFLGDLRLSGEKCWPPADNSCAMFNERELRHMKDVKDVATALFIGGLVVLISSLFAAAYLWITRRRRALRGALRTGAVLTLALIVGIVIAAIVAWDTFFELFHAIFFEADTWRFYYSDTLIRLYPEQFWFDAALAIGILTSLGALLMLLVTLKRGRIT